MTLAVYKPCLVQVRVPATARLNVAAGHETVGDNGSVPALSSAVVATSEEERGSNERRYERGGAWKPGMRKSVAATSQEELGSNERGRAW